MLGHLRVPDVSVEKYCPFGRVISACTTRRGKGACCNLPRPASFQLLSEKFQLGAVGIVGNASVSHGQADHAMNVTNASAGYQVTNVI
jgi:hypothetical protein